MRFNYVSPHSFKQAWNLGFVVQELGCRWLHPTHISGAGEHVDILKYGQHFQIKIFLTSIFMLLHGKDGRGRRKAACFWVSQNGVFEGFQMEGKMRSNPLCWLALPFPQTPLAKTWSWKQCHPVVWGEGESWGGGGVWTATVQCALRALPPLSSCCAGFSKSPELFGFRQQWKIAMLCCRGQATALL